MSNDLRHMCLEDQIEYLRTALEGMTVSRDMYRELATVRKQHNEAQQATYAAHLELIGTQMSNQYASLRTTVLSAKVQLQAVNKTHATQEQRPHATAITIGSDGNHE